MVDAAAQKKRAAEPLEDVFPEDYGPSFSEDDDPSSEDDDRDL
jgi:hypothetical protein